MRNLRLVISIDGGGIRGLMPLRILEYLNSEIQLQCNKSLFECMDLVAGTSTGAIISAAMILEDGHGDSKYSPSDLIQLYQQRGAQIFSKEREENKSPLKLVLDASFGGATIQDLKKQFLFVCYDELLKEGFVFHNELKYFRNVPLADILLASSAISPYFQPVQIGKKLFSDGIYASKNPADIALQFATNYFPDDVILLISLGTGKLSDSSFDEVERKVEYTDRSLAKMAIRNRKLIYYRLNPEVQLAQEAMDDTSPQNINALILDADNYVQQNQQVLNQIIAHCCQAQL
jgi:patatin-like phospholipase/acyl hydrolase